MPAAFLKHEHPLQVETLSEGLPRSSLRGSGSEQYEKWKSRCLMDLWPSVTLAQTGKFMSKEVVIECYQWVPQGKLFTNEQFQYERMKQTKT